MKSRIRDYILNIPPGETFAQNQVKKFLNTASGSCTPIIQKLLKEGLIKKITGQGKGNWFKRIEKKLKHTGVFKDIQEGRFKIPGNDENVELIAKGQQIQIQELNPTKHEINITITGNPIDIALLVREIATKQ